jgi:TldD protein
VVIQNGVVLGHLHSRETAAATRQAPTGHARAGTLRGAPHPRATNTFLAPDRGSRDDLLAGITLGLYLADTLGCEGSGTQLAFRPARARMIRQGRLAEPVKGVRIVEPILGLLERVEAVGADFAWDRSAAQCRDGALGVVPVSTGAPHLRFGEIQVGAAGGGGGGAVA